MPWLDRHQIPVYLAALIAGAALGLAVPAAAPWAGPAVYPLLAALLYATFLQVPFATIGHALRDLRFLSATLVLNFVAVPPVVAALTLWLPLTPAVLLGVLLTLLTPCIDYVIVFTGLAGGDARRLVVASPLLMLAQMVALPVLLVLFTGPGPVDVVGGTVAGPFLEAFLVLVAGPLVLAALTGLAAGRRHPDGWAPDGSGTDGSGTDGSGGTGGGTDGGTEGSAGRVAGAALRTAARAAHGAAQAAMVPLMAATLFAVVASQIPVVGDRLGDVAAVVPVYVAFLIVMAGVGWAAARVFRLGPAAGRALVFSGATRNSLVVLPPALALPAPYGAVTSAVVVTQTLVELLGMVVYVRVVPRLVPDGR